MGCVAFAVRLFLSTVLFSVLWQMVSPLHLSAAAEFPFQFHDGFIWVEVSTPRAEKPLNFLVDTGASASVIDQSTARQIGLKLGDRVRVSGVQTVTTGYWPQRIAAKVGEVPLPRNLLAIDLGTFSGACAKPVDGLLGADFFHGKVVQIDFRERMIRLLTAEQGRQLRGETLALDIRSCGMRVPVSVNGGEPQWLRLDTGCAAPLHWVANSVDPKSCRHQLAVGLAELSLPTTKVTAKLGAEKFDQIAAVIHEREIFAGEAGLLGAGLLSRFAQVTVDSAAKRLVLAR